MAAPMQQNPPQCGDVFVRGDQPSPWFVDTVLITQSVGTNPRPTILFPGYPLTTLNATPANSLITMQKMVYQKVTLEPGVVTRVAVIDAKSTSQGPGGAPGNFIGLKVNASKLLLSFPNISNGTVITPTLAQWKTALDRLGISWFEESTKADPQNK